MEQLCSIGALALILGVAVITLRRWHAAGTLVPAGRTPGGHRRYCATQAREVLGLTDAAEPRITLAYARVSSHDQKSSSRPRRSAWRSTATPRAGPTPKSSPTSVPG